MAKRLAGLGIYEKRIALQYPLPAPYAIAAVVWAAVLFVLFSAAQKKRKPEYVGTPFMFRNVQRLTEILLSVLAGAWFAAFAAELTKTDSLLFGFVEALCGAAAAFFVQYLIELAVKKQGLVFCGGRGSCGSKYCRRLYRPPAMMFGAHFYDGYFPKEAEAVSVVIEGVGMSRDEYEMLDGQENTVTKSIYISLPYDGRR